MNFFHHIHASLVKNAKEKGIRSTSTIDKISPLSAQMRYEQ